MEDQVFVALNNLTDKGIVAFYIWLLLEYGGVYLILGLCVWGIRVFWKSLEKE